MVTVVSDARNSPEGAPAPSRYGAGTTTPVDRFVWRPVRVPPATPGGGLDGRRVLVIGGTASARQLVARSLAENAAAVSELGTIEGDHALDADRVTATARAAVAATGGVDGIVDLGMEPQFEPARHDHWKAALMRTTAVLQAVYDDWAAESDATRCFYLTVTWMGGAMGYDRRGIAQPLGGVWAGMAKSLPHELPNCRVKVLDLDVADTDHVGRICAVETSNWDYYEVGYRDGDRYTLASDVVPAPPPRLVLAEEDIVLMSGGARGVGFAFARQLARQLGCRVIVTGRAPVPDPVADPWAGLPDDAYADRRQARLREAAGGDVAAVRRENERRDARRELARNLAAAADEGLPIEYRVCDFVDADQVHELVQSLGPRLRVVIHNAGIAAPTRLRRKPLATVLSVVEAKLVSFVNLVDALRGRPLDYFCNVGSVAGRMGGMIGQIDYAGANEVLSRLGFWAQQELGLPVATLCWTTWERIGLIANYEAALRYGAALSVEEGVQCWLDELLAAEPTESMFLGRIGTALAPTQIRGFLKFGDHPDLPWLHSRQHYLGEVSAYVPFSSLHTVTDVPADRHPCGREFTVNGAPALPVSVVLEYALALGDWIPPEGWPMLHLREVRHVRVDVSSLASAGSRMQLVRHGSAAREGGDWVVRAQMFDIAGNDLARAELVYGVDPPTAPVRPNVPEAESAWTPRPAPLAWSGLAIPSVRWRRGDGVVVGSVVPTADADLWALPHPPITQLPTAAIEGIVQASAAATVTPGRPLRFEIDCIAVGGSNRPEAHVFGSPDDGNWTVVDVMGAVRLRCAGARFG